MTTEQQFPTSFSYCPTCGAALIERLLETEERPRLVCPQGHILYINPKIVVGVILEEGNNVLLQRRGIEPRTGYWTFPGGFMEIDETLEECAARETMEEIGLGIDIGGLVGLYARPLPDGPGILSIVLRGTVSRGEPRLGREALEVRWFSSEDIPWQDLAYETTEMALRDWAGG